MPEDAVLISRVPPGLHARNGIPDPADVEARERATAMVHEVFDPLVRPESVRTSPLGPGWSRDIDVHLPDQVKPPALEELGWMPLDGLLHRLGIRSDGRWAVTERGRILAALDLHPGPAPDPLDAVLLRCRRRGEVRVREVLELRFLLREGRVLPPDDPVVRLAARVEAGLGGTILQRWSTGTPCGSPASLPGPVARSRLGRARRALRPRVVVGICGVDGSGKSTLSELLVGDLLRAGVPATPIWTRPGMRIGLLERVARPLKRLLGQDPSPGVARLGKGEPVTRLASRHGGVGWMWALLVVVSFLRDVRRRHRRGRGVLVYDRHLIDALVTLDFAYSGVDQRLHRWLIRRLLPGAALVVYLEIPPAVAVARKPDDLFGAEAIRRQLEAYKVERERIDGLRTLDGGRPPEELAGIVLGWLLKQ